MKYSKHILVGSCVASLGILCQGSVVAKTQSHKKSVENDSIVIDSKGDVILPQDLKKRLSARKIANLKARLKKVYAYKMRHPYYSQTAKSISSPSASPFHWGSVGVSAGVSNRLPTLGGENYGGGVVIGVPFGNSEKYIGGMVSVFSPFGERRANFTNSGTVGIALSRWLGSNTLIGGGVGNALPWGTSFKRTGTTYYGVITQTYRLLSNKQVIPISGSFGFASGAYAPIGQLNGSGVPNSFNDKKFYPFVNGSVNIKSNLALIGDYYSETFAVGVSYSHKIGYLPVNFVAFAANLRHTARAPSTSFGLRIATGLPLPATIRG